jgi:glycosyltransferase involved in cell wall biosynthesis
MQWLQVLFWFCILAVAYPYAIYPVLIACSNRLFRRQLPAGGPEHEPNVSIICPIHNEEAGIRAKVENLLEIDYPPEKLQIVIVGDGCTDDSLGVAMLCGAGRVVLVPLSERAGKAAALNAGLERATGDVIVFTDASILIEPGAVRALVRHFANQAIGCVSGEDHVKDGSAEGAYGRLELLLRREEAKLHSIAGASGCLYAVRRAAWRPFQAGMAPDFVSVLDTVQAGLRATCEPAARGTMSSARSPHAEFERKTRTLLRGITAAFGNAALLNPLRYPKFGFVLISHKLMRWLGPVALLGILVTSFLLREVEPYRTALFLQVVFYAVASVGLAIPTLAARFSIVGAVSFFLLVNLAAAKALCLWLTGTRREVWEPTRRSA